MPSLASQVFLLLVVMVGDAHFMTKEKAMGSNECGAQEHGLAEGC